MPGIRQGSNHAPDGAGAAGEAFEAAVNSAQAVAPISALGPAGRGSGHSASDWGARQRKWHAGLALVGKRVAMHMAGVRVRAGCARLALGCAWVAAT